MATLTKKQMSEEIWLLYFNSYLHDKGIISDGEFVRMRLRIMASRPTGGK